MRTNLFFISSFLFYPGSFSFVIISCSLQVLLCQFTCLSLHFYPFCLLRKLTLSDNPIWVCFHAYCKNALIISLHFKTSIFFFPSFLTQIIRTGAYKRRCSYETISQGDATEDVLLSKYIKYVIIFLSWRVLTQITIVV
jgi:hypothetical protein